MNLKKTKKHHKYTLHTFLEMIEGKDQEEGSDF